MTRILKRLLPAIDVIVVAGVYLSALLLRAVRRAGVERMPLSRWALFSVGVFPVRKHYYEPLVDPQDFRRVGRERKLSGIDWNVAEQLQILKSFRTESELRDLPRNKQRAFDFYVDNGAFEAGDAEYWYNLIRLLKPARIFEVGSGNSTLLAARALSRTRAEDPQYSCRHICIEPFEAPWLERFGVEVVRKRVEEVGVAFFSELKENDILFIDSSHVIRPRGDVLFEYLELLPSLNPGVVVHLHDIFSPREYPDEWVLEKVLFWNEQYLLEAFLTANAEWKIIGALNFLQHNRFEELRAKSPFLRSEDEPGSFYIQRRRK
jgi:hypothetical protein